MRRRRALLACAAAGIIGRSRAQQQEREDESRTAAEPVAIDWPTIELLSGRVLEPRSWLGHPSVIVFWATWCPFSKRHNAHVDRLYRATRDTGLFVLGVAQDREPQPVLRYLESNRFAFPVALDATHALRARLTTRKVIPLTCVIDAQARLVQALPGEMFEEDVLAFAGLVARTVR